MRRDVRNLVLKCLGSEISDTLSCLRNLVIAFVVRKKLLSMDTRTSMENSLGLLCGISKTQAGENGRQEFSRRGSDEVILMQHSQTLNAT